MMKSNVNFLTFIGHLNFINLFLKQDYIIAAPNNTLKLLSKALTAILKLFFYQIESIISLQMPVLLWHQFFLGYWEQ